jgi:hypothetical protein
LTPVKTAQSLALLALSFDTGISERAAPKLIKAPTLEATEVKRPRRSDSPHATDSVARTRFNSFGSGPAIQAIEPKKTSAIPTTARSKTSPAPGKPSGKIEKADRSVSLINHNRLDCLFHRPNP